MAKQPKGFKKFIACLIAKVEGLTDENGKPNGDIEAVINETLRQLKAAADKAEAVGGDEDE